jgi:hypothetical protein
MPLTDHQSNLVDIRKFLKKYHYLLFWLVWGFIMTLVFGHFFNDYKTHAVIFMGFGIFLGVSLQFIANKWLKRAAVFISIIMAVIMFWKPVVSFTQVVFHQKISREFLVNDIRQMAAILDNTHPDPYINGGGKVAFNRTMQKLIRTIPTEGLTQIEFYRHLCPLLAFVKDGHTALWPPYHLDSQSPGGIPLYFKAVAGQLYVAAVIDSGQKYLIGSLLHEVEGIPIDELLKRQALIKGYDNAYQLLRYLGYDGSLWYDNTLQHVIPEWDGGSIKTTLINPQGTEIEVILEPNRSGQDKLITAETSYNLPPTDRSDYVYQFVDQEKKSLLFLIENMYAYRETFEMEMVLQGSLRRDLANYLYQRYNKTSPPAKTNTLLAGIPSATELCRELIITMKENQSENLIIDLRRNQGGNAFISTILFYFLYGKEELISFSDRKSIFIKKYSPLFWKQYPGRSLNEVNSHRSIELMADDYDFSGYPEAGQQLSHHDAMRIIEEEAVAANTFWQEYQSGTYAGYYCPKNILILCSPFTNSSGYAFMYDHWAAGAKVIGIPSSQAGNGFGAWVGFSLKYSRLKGGISHLYITHFRDNSDMGRIFRPDYEMTYDDLKSYNFDPNAEILLALDLINSQQLINRVNPDNPVIRSKD